MKRHEKLTIFLFCLFLSALFFYRAFTQHLLIAPQDGWLEHYPWRLYYAHHFLRQGIHLWVPYLFLGLPFLGTLQTGILYPLNWIYFFISTPYAYNLSLIAHYALAAYFTYLYLRLLGTGKIPAVLAGITFAFPGFLMAHKQHPSMVDAAVWLPLLLYFYERIRRNLRIEDALGASLIVAVQLFAGHFQISFYSYLVLGLFMIYFTVVERKNRMRFLGLGFLPLLLGILIAYPQIVAVKELVALNFHASLGLQTLVLESFPPHLLGTFFFPFMFGGGYDLPYVAQGYLVEYSAFTGILALVVALITVVKYSRAHVQVRFWGMVGVCALFLGVGGHWMPLASVLSHLPFFRLFRAPSRNIFELDFSIAVLFGLGYEYYLTANWRRTLTWGLSCVLGLAFLILWTKSLFISSPSFWVPASFIAIYILWTWVAPRNKPWHGLLIISLVFAEAFFSRATFDAAWPPLGAEESLTHNPAFQYLADNLDHERFAYSGYYEAFNYGGLPIVNSTLGIRLLNGYDPLVPDNVRDLLDINYFGYFFREKALFRNNLMLSLLGTRYVIVPPDEDLSYSGLPRFKKAAVERLSSEPSGDRPQQIPYYPDAAYQVVLEAKADKPLSSPLVFALFADDFHSIDGQLTIYPIGITSAFQRYSKLIFVPEKIHGPLYAQIYTLSKQPVQIRNVQINVIRNYHPYFMHAPSTGQTSEMHFYRKVFQSGNFVIWENRNALPRLFPIQTLQTITTLNDMKEQIYMLQANPAQTAFIFPRDLTGLKQTHFSEGTVEEFHETTDDIHAKVNFPGTGFLVLSDEYFPGWEAFIDGHETKIYLIDGALRGVVVPPGTHGIDFQYKPTQVYAAFGVGAIVLFGVLGALGFLWRLKKKNLNIAV